MTRSPRWSPRLAALAASRRSSSQRVVAPPPSTAPSAAATPSAGSAAPPPERGTVRAAGLAGERRGPVRRGRRARRRARQVHRQLQEDHGDRCEDRRVRAVRPGRGLPLEDRVHLVRDQRHRLARVARSTRPARRTRRSSASSTARALQARGLEPRLGRHHGPQRRLLGRQAAKTERSIIRWSTEAAQRLVELQSGTVDGIDNVGPTDFATVEGDADLQLIAARGPEHLLPRLQQHVHAVRQREGPPGDRHGHRPAADRRQLLPAGLRGRDALHAVRDPGRLRRRRLVRLRPGRGQGAAGRGRLPGRLRRPRSSTATSSAATCPTRTSSHRTSRPSSRPTSASPPTIEVQESGTFIDNADDGKLDGIHILGWGADYPDATNFLDYHFGAGASHAVRRQVRRHHAAARGRAPAALDDAGRASRPTSTANNAIKTHVPMVPIAHGGSAVAYRADVADAHTSPLGNETFAVMTPGDRTQFVWMQNAEPLGLYCADETDGEALRVCEQMLEGAVRLRDRRHRRRSRRWPRSASRTPSSRSGPARCATGVTFHDGADARRQRRRPVVRGPVGRRASAPQGPGRCVHVLPGPVRWVPQPAATAPADQPQHVSNEGRRQPAAPFEHPPDHPSRC